MSEDDQTIETEAFVGNMDDVQCVSKKLDAT